MNSFSDPAEAAHHEPPEEIHWEHEMRDEPEEKDDRPDVFTISVVDLQTGYIMHQEHFNEKPNFAPEGIGYNLTRYHIDLTAGNINGGDTMPYHWDTKAGYWKEGRS
jgi:hypothetical protein